MKDKRDTALHAAQHTARCAPVTSTFHFLPSLSLKECHLQVTEHRLAWSVVADEPASVLRVRSTKRDSEAGLCEQVWAARTSSYSAAGAAEGAAKGSVSRNVL